MSVPLREIDGGWVGEFECMASPCEVMVEVADSLAAHRLIQEAAAEARRIEAKFSRYRDDSVVARIHDAHGAPVDVDDETGQLLDLADRCHELSHGRFDPTSGILRTVWTFDGSDRLPSRKQVKTVLPRIGWQKVTWRSPTLILPESMEIDFGGIGKEYAVDRVSQLLTDRVAAPSLVNFGGDLRVSGPRNDGSAWRVGIETPDEQRRGDRGLDVRSGALATSGDARRFILAKGERYSHILNPRTGWPVRGAPRSVTVAAGSCTEAGILATIAMLHGSEAESFLESQDVQFWSRR